MKHEVGNAVPALVSALALIGLSSDSLSFIVDSPSSKYRYSPLSHVHAGRVARQEKRGGP